LPVVVIRALLFDFDGLLLDTETPELVSWQELWQEHGHPFPLERFLAGIGTVGGFGALDALDELAGPLDRDSVGARHSARKLALIGIEELRPGVLEYLEEARERDLRTAIVSSSSREWIDAHLERLERAQWFDVIVTGDHDRRRGKPRRTLFLEALKQLEVEPGEAVAFEDSPNGVRAARAAGVFCVAIPNSVTANLGFDEADLVCESLGQLPLASLLDHLSRGSPAWSLRPATVADRDFLFEINRRTMREYVEAVWGWDDAFQARFFDEHFDPGGNRQIIQADRRDIGMVEVWDRPRDLLLASIRVLPEWQGRGIGSSILRWLLGRSARAGKPVALRVLKVNERARRLYEREGFRTVDETETHLRMVCDPADRSAEYSNS